MLNILITGARGGIGLDTTIRLLKKGYKVYATVHREESIKPLKEKLSVFNERAVVEKLDINNESDRKKVDDYNIDVLINNAAIGDSGPLAEIDIKRVKNVFETNLFSTLELTKRIIPKMIKNGKGKIIFISSMAGLMPTPFLSPYASTKFALENIIFSLRGELKPFNISVIAINPGAYDTGFNLKNINKKYEWMRADSMYKNNMEIIKRAEKDILNFELKGTKSIAREIVKATLATRPKRRYKAPWWQWVAIPFLRRFK